MSALLPTWGSTAGEVARAVLVGVAFLGLLFAAEAWKRIGRPPVEWTRKLVHVAGGVVSATFPWVFATHVTVLLLCAASFAILALGKRAGLLSSVTEVERRSTGELLFPFSVYLLFVVAHGHPMFYVIALSTLVLSDTAAALLGTAYGRHTYTVASDRKSLEGSAAFLVVTFVAVHVMLLLGTPIDRAASVLIAVQLALLVTSFEAISMGGNDNLVVPLMTYYMLVKLTPSSWQGIAWQLAVQLGLLLVMVLLSFRTRFLTLAGAIAAHLALYAAFSLGGPTWCAAPVLALIGFLAIYRGTPDAPDGPGHEVRQVFYVSIVSMVFLFLDNSYTTLSRPPQLLNWRHPFFVPFVGSLATTLAIVGYRASRMRGRSPVASVIALPVAWGLVAPLALALGPTGLEPRSQLGTLLMCCIGLALYALARMRVRLPSGGLHDLRLQALCVAVASAAAYPLGLMPRAG